MQLINSFRREEIGGDHSPCIKSMTSSPVKVITAKKRDMKCVQKEEETINVQNWAESSSNMSVLDRCRIIKDQVSETMRKRSVRKSECQNSDTESLKSFSTQGRPRANLNQSWLNYLKRHSLSKNIPITASHQILEKQEGEEWGTGTFWSENKPQNDSVSDDL